MKKKSILLACIMAASLNTSAKAEESALDFPVVRIDSEIIDLAAESSTEELCASAAQAMLLCESNTYNVINIIINLRDAVNSRACNAGFEYGTKETIKYKKTLPQDVQDRLGTCQIRIID